VAAAGETVRPADVAEAARIAQVIRAAFGQYRRVLEPPSGALALDAAAVRDLMKLGGILACECDGRIVACVFHRTHADHVYLGRLAVLPAFRGRGLGARLVAEIEALPAATGCGWAFDSTCRETGSSSSGSATARSVSTRTRARRSRPSRGSRSG